MTEDNIEADREVVSVSNIAVSTLLGQRLGLISNFDVSWTSLEAENNLDGFAENCNSTSGLLQIKAVS